MKRIYTGPLLEHLKKDRQMLFLSGPRQVGKTTFTEQIGEHFEKVRYLNWDNQQDRFLILAGPDALLESFDLHVLGKEKPLLILDELHKYEEWKNFLKGLFDLAQHKLKIMVTGSARLDVYKKGGDSLMGRYFPYRLHPLSVRELLNPNYEAPSLYTMPKELSKSEYERLLTFGGFPEPYIKNEISFYQRWKKLRLDQLIKEDIRDATRIQEIGQMALLADFVQLQSGQLTSLSSLATKVNVSVDTVKRWLQILRSFYYCFSLQPWSNNVSRSLIKEPKFYLWDWSVVEDKGAKYENFVASHLLKAVHFWNDLGLGDFDLHFIRDKEKREVDFLVTRSKKPWILVEVKSKDTSFSPSLLHFNQHLKPAHTFQVVMEMDYVDKDCFSVKEPVVVPALTFLSQLI